MMTVHGLIFKNQGKIWAAWIFLTSSHACHARHALYDNSIIHRVSADLRRSVVNLPVTCQSGNTNDLMSLCLLFLLTLTARLPSTQVGVHWSGHRWTNTPVV